MTEKRNKIYLRSGQARAYQDSVSVFEFDATDEADALAALNEFEFGVENRLDGASHNGSCGFPFGLESFYSLEKISDGRWRCSVTSPYCD